MSYSAYSYVVYGVKVPRFSIKQSVKIRGCHHEIEDSMKFCPECGKPSYIEKKQDILDSMEDKKLSYFYSDYEGKDDVVIGFCLAKTSYNTNTMPIECDTPTPDMSDELNTFLKQYDFPYTEKNFKTYVMTYHSY